MSRNALWCAEIERFGYTMRAYSNSAEGAREAIMTSYIKTYESKNGVSPRDRGVDGEYYDFDEQKWVDADGEEITRSDVKTYEDLAREEMYVRRIETDIVYWE